MSERTSGVLTESGHCVELLFEMAMDAAFHTGGVATGRGAMSVDRLTGFVMRSTCLPS